MVRNLSAVKVPTHNGRHYSNSDQRRHYRYRNQKQSKQQTNAYRQNRTDYYDPQDDFEWPHPSDIDAMGSPHCLGRPNVRIRLLARRDNFRLGLWSVCIFLSHLSEPIREVEIRDQRLDLVKSAAMTDRQSQLECLLTNCTHRSFHHLGNLFYW